ncbi:MAG: 4-(cytidine 5'-diphospho)-2-C-methyl-D-erythritol kinase [Acetobacteraceae bacterium]
MLEEPAPAKVNLYLRVTGRRPDGKHTLDSLVVFADVADRVSLEPGAHSASPGSHCASAMRSRRMRTQPQEAGLRLSVDGPFGAGLSAGPDNLVLRAAEAAARRDARVVPASFRLIKNLPCAAGIGGGSADAAATLRLIGRVFGVGGLGELAAGLGADVPVCMASKAARMGGIGEVLTPAPALPPFGLCLVHPGIALATGRVFAQRFGGFSGPAFLPSVWRDAERLAADLARFGNDLAAPAIALCPEISVVLAALAAVPGALLARMSGSGATCFGLFRDAATAAEAARRLCRSGWWCWGGGLAPAVVGKALVGP